VLIGGSGLLAHATDLHARHIPVVVSQLGDTAHRENGPLTRRADDLLYRLVLAGVEPALGSGDVSGATRWLRVLVAEEIGRGLLADDALRSVTLWAARAADVDREMGSLTPGKRADLVVWSGDPFRVTSRAERVFVGGREVLDAP
jgi:imidazolonepropionase-like amidohydrolase